MFNLYSKYNIVIDGSLYSRPNGKHAKLERFKSMHHVLVRVQYEQIPGRKYYFTKYMLSFSMLYSYALNYCFMYIIDL